MALEALSPLPRSTRRLEGSLVAPTAPLPVPNRLADTKIFSKAIENGVLQPKPAVIHFDGYRVGQLHKHTLRIVNISKDNQQMHVIAPTTPFFSIKYSKQRSRLVPGLSLDVTVHFRPTKWMYYYDCIRIHCKGDHNLLVPIHAYPVMNTARFPRNVKFPPTAVGQEASKTLFLECDVPIDFEFQLSFHQQHPAFTVTPMKGVVPANGKVGIKVTFAPTEFNTAAMTLQLEVSQFNSSPVVCTFTGSSSPGLAVERVKQQSVPRPPKQPRPPQSSKTLVASARKAAGKATSNATTLLRAANEDVVYEGIRFPAELTAPSAVSKVLAQQPGRLKATQLKQASSELPGSAGAGQQVKEALFLQEVKEAAAEERANQLRWVTNLGGVAMTSEERGAVLQARADHMAGGLGEKAVSSSTECVYKRTRRRVGEVPASVPTFDPYLNDTWRRRHSALQRFAQAGRLVVVRERARHRLDKLQKLCSLLKSGNTVEEALAVVSSQADSSGGSAVAAVTSQLPSTAAHILPFSFPSYQQQSLRRKGEGLQQQQQQQQQQGGGGATEVDVRKAVEYMSLKVPQQYKLAGYSPQPLPAPSGVQSYLSPSPGRQLRTGAQDELCDLGHVPGVDLELFASSLLLQTAREDTVDVVDPAELTVEDVEGVRGEGGGGERLSFAPPSALYKPMPRHPLHIFNPCPGVHSYAPMLPHSEVSMEHALLPLPTFPSSAPSAAQPDPIDVIPGVMQWKSFPSHCLVSLEGSKKLVSVWRPRQSPSASLLPPSLPTPQQLMTGAQPDDAELLDTEDNGEPLPVPTMDMVRAQFYVPEAEDSRNERALAAGRLKDDQCKEFNQLGRRMAQRLETLVSVLGDTRSGAKEDHT